MSINESKAQDLLKEIFIVPATEIKAERFSSENQAADCMGKCSGVCGGGV